MLDSDDLDADGTPKPRRKGAKKQEDSDFEVRQTAHCSSFCFAHLLSAAGSAGLAAVRGLPAQVRMKDGQCCISKAGGRRDADALQC